MTASQQVGGLVVTVGLALVLLGLVIWLGGFAWFGHLPGDIRIERESVRIYLPLASMLVLSVALSLLVHLARRLLG